ncbi:MAG: Gfo/Idh/MocA family oxidoreductase [Planctomycetaceae bacterium]|nr:Gfo/Idh/MocA family oxidoreductase [Planctomycetaceae bacterium]
MIKAGIIGLGPVWETRYCPALDALSSKVKVAAIYDAVEERAHNAAKRFDAIAVKGVSALSRRADLDACLILGKDWTNLPALKFLCEARKPAYIAGSLGHEIPTVGEIHLLALSEGLTFMPEFARRYTPATVRLRELIATRLGKAERILCDARLPLPSRRDYVPGQADYEDFLIGLFDWCLHILPGSARDVLCLPLESEEWPGDSTRIRFLHRDAEASATLRIYQVEARDDRETTLEPGDVRFEIHCEKGIVRIESADTISWEIEGEEKSETLTSDRTDAFVMLDHFFRRVVGGLIPVADLSDICRAINIFRAYEGSKVVRKAVPVPGQTKSN